MDDSLFAVDGLAGGLKELSTQLVSYLPTIALAVLVLLVGWLVARLARTLVVRAIGRLDRLWQRITEKQGLEYLQSRQPPARIVGELVFWLLMLVIVTLVTEILGLAVFGAWLKDILAYLPLLAGGLLIVLVGFVASSLARDLVAAAATSGGVSHSDLLGRFVQVVILLIAIIIGIDQIGFDIAFLSAMGGIVLAAMLGGFSLAFGLGACTHVSNIISASQLRTIYQVGDRVRIGDIEGQITDIGVSRVLIETASGSVDVPAKVFDEEVTVIIEKGE